LRRNAATGCSHGGKILIRAKNCSHRLPPGARFKPWPRFQLCESKFHRDSDFETPVAVFSLQGELYAVTSGLAAVGAVEQPVAIYNVLVDGVSAILIVAVPGIEITLCRSGYPPLRCAIFVPND